MKNMNENNQLNESRSFTPKIYEDNMDPEEFRSYVMRYLPEFRKDKHKVNYNFSVKANCLGLPYIVMVDDETGEPAGYMCYDVHKLSGKIVATTHCLSVRPAYRGHKLSERMIRTMEELVVRKFKVQEIYEITNEISMKAYKKCGFDETGSYRLSKSGERILIRLKKYINQEV